MLEIYPPKRNAMKQRLLFVTALIGCFALHAQSPPNTLEEYQKQYERRIRQPYLNGVYIPEDIGDAFIQFGKLISADSKAKFKAMSEADASVKLHYSFGRWISVNWGFEEGSRFSHYLKQLGLSHPDDMIRFVLICYHRNLNKKPLEPKPLIQEMVDARRKAYRERQLKLLAEQEKRDSSGGN